MRRDRDLTLAEHAIIISALMDYADMCAESAKACALSPYTKDREKAPGLRQDARQARALRERVRKHWLQYQPKRRAP